MQFPLATVRNFRFTLLNSISLLLMLVLGFVEMCPLMLDLFLTGASVVEVCFLCLEVSCYT